MVLQHEQLKNNFILSRNNLYHIILSSTKKGIFEKNNCYFPFFYDMRNQNITHTIQEQNLSYLE